MFITAPLRAGGGASGRIGPPAGRCPQGPGDWSAAPSQHHTRCKPKPPSMASVDLHHLKTLMSDGLQCVGDRLLRVPTHTQQVVSVQHRDTPSPRRPRSGPSNNSACQPAWRRIATQPMCQTLVTQRDPLPFGYRKPTCDHRQASPPERAPPASEASTKVLLRRAYFAGSRTVRTVTAMISSGMSATEGDRFPLVLRGLIEPGDLGDCSEVLVTLDHPPAAIFGCRPEGPGELPRHRLRS